MDYRGSSESCQGLFRRKRARKNLLILLGRRFEKVWDSNSDEFYWWDKKTETSSWARPSLLKEGEEIPESVELPDKIQESKASRKEWTDEDASVAIQNLFRRRKARKMLLHLVGMRYEKVWDANSNAHYYFDKQMNESSWVRPVLLRDGEEIPDVVRLPDEDSKASDEDEDAGKESQDEMPEKEKAAEEGNKKIAYTKDDAALLIQKLFRRKAARKRLLLALGSIFEEVKDKSRNEVYYYNKVTDTSSWERPALLRPGEVSSYCDCE